MLSGLAIVLGVTALLAGLTGAWSPCGFSMVDTLASSGRHRGRGVFAAACASFSLGALAGGSVVFGGLAALGAVLDTGGSGAAGAVAVAVAVAGAVAELMGVRIRPQVRRQVPEPWRRLLPLPVAAALYGVLLGLGFATFVLTLAVAALAAICLALGDPELGLVVGLGFGLGRALPVVTLAWAGDSSLGIRATELMAERPASLRGLRVLDGAALAACAVSVGTGSAWAATPVATPATDPSVAPGALAWQRPGTTGVLVRDGQELVLQGSNPAVGDQYVAWRVGDSVTVALGSTLAPAFRFSLPGVDRLAVSSQWLAYRFRRPGGGDTIAAIRLGSSGPARAIASVRTSAGLGRPDLDGDRLAFHLAGRRGSAIRIVNLRSGRRRTAARARLSQLLNPSLLGRALLYVRISRCGQQLRLRRGARTRVLLRRRALAGTDAGFDSGHTRQGSGLGPCPLRRPTSTMLWSTALSGSFAYLTLAHPETARPPSLVSVRR